MFSKSSKDAAKPEPQTDGPASPAKPSPPTLISKDLRIVGDLRSDGEIQVDGAPGLQALIAGIGDHQCPLAVRPGRAARRWIVIAGR